MQAAIGYLRVSTQEQGDSYISDLLRGLLGRFHERVKDPNLLIERYRGRFRDQVLQAAYYAAWHHEGSGYSPNVEPSSSSLAGLQGPA